MVTDARIPGAAVEEASAMAEALKGGLPRRVDGRAAIYEMRAGGNRHWKQMEWIGWYFEWKIGTLVREAIGGGLGPKFGRTTFDFMRRHVWDLKAHPRLKPNGAANQPMILNDQDAVRACIQKHRGLGFVVVYGTAEFHGGAEFKRWHDELKGGVSAYEKGRIARGARSRARKTAFAVEGVDFVFFGDVDTLRRGVHQGWVGSFQEGMRNADGSPRRPKFSIRTDRLPGFVRPIDPLVFARSGPD